MSLLHPSLARVSVILPTYNEQACIEKTIDAVLDYHHTHPNYQFIFVNDGSLDRTQKILQARIQSVAEHTISLISYHDRAGKGYAVRQGVKAATGDYICYLDSDLAYSLKHLDLLVEKLCTHDVVIGCRSLVEQNSKGLSWNRKVAGRVFNRLSRLLLNLDYRDMQAGLKGFSKDSARVLFRQQRLTGFAFDVELIYLAKKIGYEIAEIPAALSDHHQQKLSKVNLWNDSIKMFLELWKIKFYDVSGYYSSPVASIKAKVNDIC